jgi:hypothetical protein
MAEVVVREKDGDTVRDKDEEVPLLGTNLAFCGAVRETLGAIAERRHRAGPSDQP